MKTYVALLRAVNVGGTGKLPMADLKRMCEELGFARVRTYIASGNVVFASKLSAAKVKEALEAKLAKLAEYAGKAVAVFVREGDELQRILHDNPYAGCKGNYAYVFFLDAAPTKDALANVTGQSDEELALGQREIYVHYPSGMGRSKLKIPAAKDGTSRNLNTVTKLAEMAAEA